MHCAIVGPPGTDLEPVARLCSPRVEMHGPEAAVFDARGLSRVIGTPLGDKHVGGGHAGSQ